MLRVCATSFIILASGSPHGKLIWIADDLKSFFFWLIEEIRHAHRQTGLVLIFLLFFSRQGHGKGDIRPQQNLRLFYTRSQLMNNSPLFVSNIYQIFPRLFEQRNVFKCIKWANYESEKVELEESLTADDVIDAWMKVGVAKPVLLASTFKDSCSIHWKKC